MNINSILCRYCEIALKGRNRSMFEQQLINNIKHLLREIDDIKVLRTRGRLWIKKEGNFSDSELEILKKQLPKAFGLASFSPGTSCERNIDEIKTATKELSKKIFIDTLKAKKSPSFRIRARRADKSFPLNHTQVEIELATLVGESFDQDEKLRVDLENADITVFCEIREESAFVYLETYDGPGGLPTGSNSPVLALLSGGIDSPVACTMMMKRGCHVDFITFHSYPYTTLESVDKVNRLMKILNEYQQPGRLFVCNLAPIQKEIRDNCSERFRTILYRRYMFRIAEEIAKRIGSKALVTGEAVGQVASQTIVNLGTIGAAIKTLVLRPLAGLDKEEVILKARKFETFEISIEQVPDSCTVFAPSSPATAAPLDRIEKEEAKLELDELLQKTIEETFSG